MTFPASAFWDLMKARGITLFSGVPCSLLRGLLAEAEQDPEIRYVPAVRENAALGVASGAALAGRRSGVLMQNSGLGNVVNALTSFNRVYRVPVLLVISWRGEGGGDAPEHRIMGPMTPLLLETLGVPAFLLEPPLERPVDRALAAMESRGEPAALILRKGVVA